MNATLHGPDDEDDTEEECDLYLGEDGFYHFVDEDEDDGAPLAVDEFFALPLGERARRWEEMNDEDDGEDS
jgi:hypothetical protein